MKRETFLFLHLNYSIKNVEGFPVTLGYIFKNTYEFLLAINLFLSCEVPPKKSELITALKGQTLKISVLFF